MGFPGILWAESEFVAGPNGATLYGTCGPCAGGMAESWALQQYIGTLPGKPATRVFYDRMRANGLCDPSGVTTAGKIAAQLAKDGFKAVRHNGAGWLAFMKQAAAAPAVSVLLFQNAHVLHDEMTGAGMDAGSGLRGHFVMASEYHPGGYNQRAARILPEGFFCSDGDSDVTNPVVNGHRTRRVADHRLVFYSVATLSAADIVDVVAVYPKASFTPNAPALPAGYVWDAVKGTLTAPNKVVMVGGIAAKVKADLELGIWQAGYPDGPEFKITDGQGELVAEAFGSATLLWRPGWAAPRYATDAEMSALIGRLAPGKAA